MTNLFFDCSGGARLSPAAACPSDRFGSRSKFWLLRLGTAALRLNRYLF